MNVLIIGLGSIAHKHILALQQLAKDVTFYALRSNRNVTSEVGIINLFDYNKLSMLPFDFAIISNPTALHTSVLLKLVELQIPLFIEKPISHKLGDEEIRVKQWLESHAIKNYVAYTLRYHPVIQYIKSYLISTELRIEEVNIYCGTYLPSWRPDANFRNIYSSIPELGGGVHLDMSHELDYALWLFGKPLSVEKYFKSSSSLNIPSIDYANYILDYAGYAISIILNYYRNEPKRTIEVVSTTGVIKGDLIEWSISIPQQEAVFFKQDVPSMYKNQMRDFLNYLNTGDKEVENNYTQSIELLEIVL